MNLSSDGHMYLMATMLNSAFLEATSPDAPKPLHFLTQSTAPRQKRI